jgi:hypothetical protein
MGLAKAFIVVTLWSFLGLRAFYQQREFERQTALTPVLLDPSANSQGILRFGD